MKFTFPRDIAKCEFMLYDFLTEREFIDELQEMMGFNFLDEDISQLIEIIERIQIRKQRELVELCKTSTVGRALHNV
jgi:hypothetical protein